MVVAAQSTLLETQGDGPRQCGRAFAWFGPNGAQKELAVCGRVKQDHHHLFSLHRNAPPFGVQNPPKDQVVTHPAQLGIQQQRVNPEPADPPSSSKQPCLTEQAYYRNTLAARANGPWASRN